MVSRSRTSGSGYGDLTLNGTELQVLKKLHILGVTFDSTLTFETHLQEVVSKTARNLMVVRQAGKPFDCPRVLNGCFNAFVMSSLEYYAPVRTSSTESHLRLLDSIVYSAEWLCEYELCSLGRRRKVSVLCLLY